MPLTVVAGSSRRPDASISRRHRSWLSWSASVDMVSPCSRQNTVNHLPLNVGEAVIAPGVAVGELRVVKPQEVQDGGVEVGHRDLVFGDVIAEIVGPTVGD